MLISKRTHALAAAAALAGVATLQTGDAEACGGLFCNASLPVNQAAERIIFSENGDGTVTAVIEIQYQGPSESFAWVLPVPAGELEIGVASKISLDRLDTQSNPTYQLNRVFPEDCNFPQAGGAPTDSASSDDSATDDGGGEDEGPSVVVLEEGTTGPYNYQVLAVNEDVEDRAAELIAWLQEREYDVEDDMIDLVRPYLDSGLNVVAFKLDKNSDAGSVRPVMITYESEVPFIPLRPTAMAALEDMGVKVWVLGNSRAIPTTYLHLEINQALINWFNPNANYNDVIIAAANEAGGMGFVTEQSGAAGAFADAVYTQDPDLGGGDAWRRDQLATTNFGTGVQSYISFFETAVGYFNNYDGFLEVMGDPEVVPLREGAGVEQFISCVECYFSEVSGAGTVYPPTPFDPENDPILEFDAFAFLDAVDAEILDPMAKTRALFDDASHVTRMYTTISPDEMLEDPAFDFNPELEDVDNQHIADQLLQCEDDGWTIELPQGMSIKGSGVTWPLEIGGEMPANLRILQMSTVGGGMAVEDNAAQVAELLTSLGVGEAGPGLEDPPGPDPDPVDPDADPELTDDEMMDDDASDPSNQQDDDDDDTGPGVDADDETDADDDSDEDDSDADDDSDEDDSDEDDDSDADDDDDDDDSQMADAGSDPMVNSAANDDDDGCGCRAVGHSAPISNAWAGLGLLGLALLRRRRR